MRPTRNRMTGQRNRHRERTQPARTRTSTAAPPTRPPMAARLAPSTARPRDDDSGRCDAMNSGDTAWLLVATALVMVMLPGLAFFYGGLVRRKNVLSTIAHSVFGLAIVSIIWVLWGFSLAFGPDLNGLGLIGGPDFLGFSNVGLEPDPRYAATIPLVLFASFQLMF